MNDTVVGLPGTTFVAGSNPASENVLAAPITGALTAPLELLPHAVIAGTAIASAPSSTVRRRRPAGKSLTVHLVLLSVCLVDDQRRERLAALGGDLEAQAPAPDHHQGGRGARVDPGLGLGELVLLLWHLHLQVI